MIIDLANIQRTKDQIQLLQDFSLKLQQLALAYIIQKRAHRLVRERSGDTEKQRITAKVVDQNGNLRLDEEGNIITTEFDVIDASIDNTGLLKIKLIAIDQNYWKREEKEYNVEVELECEGIKIILPRGYINKQGIVEIMSDLKTSNVVSFIPTKNISISVISK